MLELTFLGTAAAVPSRDRTMSCIAVRQGPSVTLFDCAEGSQRQIMVSPLSFMKINAIFITHMHGDHVLGLPGLLQTMGMSGRSNSLIVCGPRGFSRSLEMLLGACEGEIGYDMKVRELEPGDTVSIPGATVEAFRTEHGIPSLGYIYREDDSPGRFDKAKAISLGLSPGPDFAALQRGEAVRGVTPSEVIGPSRRGPSLAYTGDTLSSDSIAESVEGVDVIIHESTYDSGEMGLAVKNLHSTCTQAAETAVRAGAKGLILTHISNRYDDTHDMLAHARDVFPSTYVANDMDSFEITTSGLRSA